MGNKKLCTILFVLHIPALIALTLGGTFCLCCMRKLACERLPGWGPVGLEDVDSMCGALYGPFGMLVLTVVVLSSSVIGIYVLILARRKEVEILRRSDSDAELRESREQYKTLIDNLPNIVFKGYQDWFVEFYDDKIETMTGYSKEEFNSSKLKWVDLILEEDLPVIQSIFTLALKGRRSYMREYRIRARWGEVLWVEEGSQIVCDEEGKVKFVTGAFLNVTERRRAEEAVWQNQEKFLKIFDASPDGIGIETFEGARWVDANEAFLTATGYKREEVIGHSSSEIALWDNPDDRNTIVRIIKGGGKIRNMELKYRCRSGEVRTMLCSADTIELGGETCLLIINRDISERKLLEEQLRQSQRLKSLGVLAGGVAHDFNNLLQIIQGYAELLFVGKSKEEPEYRKLEGIIEASRRGGELTTQMLTFSRNAGINKRPINLNHVVEQVITLLEHVLPKKIELDVQSAANLKLIDGDSVQIEQMLINLVVNSKDAMPDGGKIIVETRNVTLGEDYCAAYPSARPGHHVLLIVSDSGRGMDRDTLDCVFEPFYSTKGPESGAGLGLAIVYGIVQSHEGHIVCHSEPGMGTVFKIFLPAVNPHEAGRG